MMSEVTTTENAAAAGHTPGPCYVLESDAFPVPTAALEDSSRVFTARVWAGQRGNPGYNETSEADALQFARLLASSPELLAALKLAVVELENAREFALRFDDPDDEEIETSESISAAIEQAETAILKAEGR